MPYFEAIIHTPGQRKNYQTLIILSNDFNEVLTSLRKAYGNNLRKIIFDANKNPEVDPTVQMYEDYMAEHK